MGTIISVLVWQLHAVHSLELNIDKLTSELRVGEGDGWGGWPRYLNFMIDLIKGDRFVTEFSFLTFLNIRFHDIFTCNIFTHIFHSKHHKFSD